MRGEGASPPKPTPGIGQEGGGEPTCADYIDAKIVWVRQSGGTRNILFNWREGQTGEEVGVSLVSSSTV